METFLWICLVVVTGAVGVAAVLGICDIPPFNQYFGSHIREAIRILRGK